MTGAKHISIAACAAVLFALWAGAAMAKVSDFGDLSRRAKTGDLTQVEADLADSRAAGVLRQDEVRFLSASILARKGQLAEAEEILRDMLDVDPSLRLVRFELANVLWARGSFTAARYHLDQLTLSEPDARVRSAYVLAANAILQERKWTADVSIGLTSSSNANGGSTKDTVTILNRPFVIDPGSKAKDATGLRYQATVGRRFAIGANTSGLALAFVQGDYFSDPTLRYTEAGVGLRATMQGAKGGQTMLGAEVSSVWSGGSPYSDNITLRGEYALPARGRTRRSVDGAMTHVNYRSAADADGIRGNIALRATHVPRAGREIEGYLRLSADRSRSLARQFQGYEVGLSVSQEFRGGLTVLGEISAGARQYQGNLPLVGYARHDTYGGVRATLTNRRWAIAGFAPQISLGYDVQKSNSNLFSFDKLGASFSLTRRF